MKNFIDELEEMKYIALADCKISHIYKIYARNFKIGVFDGSDGFIGIREKFGSRYLFTEYHWDTGEPHGTVKPIEDIGELPSEIEPLNSNKLLFDYLENLK
jgi:hypothetical protein